MMDRRVDAVIAGTGVAGLFAALNLPEEKEIIMITKSDICSSDSYLAQGGICVLRGLQDYDSFFEDTMRAGRYENRRESVDIMLRGSREIVSDLIGCGVEFARENGEFVYTREGAHSRPRILFHEDITGQEITEKLIAQVKKRSNVTIYEYMTMTDILTGQDGCIGIMVRNRRGENFRIYAEDTILATGGIGGRYQNSTNFSHLTGDSVEIALRHGIRVQNLDYVQIHPTTLYSTKPGRRFLISESVRGEGAVLYDAHGKRFTDELQPRDVVTQAIKEQMEKDGTDHVWLSLEYIDKEKILSHFPNIYRHCLEEGYDVLKEWIPVVPAQHYFMGGVWVDSDSRTSMEHLYAVGETSCNGVHGANRLASNSLLEALVFSKRAAKHIEREGCTNERYYHKITG